MKNNPKIPIFYRLKPDALSIPTARGETRKFFGIVSSIHLYLQNIWEDSDNIDDFMVKMIIVHLTELTCCFTTIGTLECEKREGERGYSCPFLRIFAEFFNVEYEDMD